MGPDGLAQIFGGPSLVAPGCMGTTATFQGRWTEQHVSVAWPAPGVWALGGDMASFILGRLGGPWEFVSFSISEAVFLLPLRAKSWGAARGQLRHGCVRGPPMSFLSPSLGLYLPGGSCSND